MEKIPFCAIFDFQINKMSLFREVMELADFLGYGCRLKKRSKKKDSWTARDSDPS